MLKKRIIPLLLLQNGRMVKTVQFGKNDYRDVGDPITAARVYDAQRADELVFLDISASKERRGIFLDIVRQAAEECFMPLGVGGGVRTITDIRQLLSNGADKVIINTGAVESPEFITEATEKFGSSTIIISIDVKTTDAGKREVFIRGGSEATGLDPVQWASEVERRGAGEILITSIDREGTMSGLDIELVKDIVAAVGIPVIASGGVGSLEDFKQGFNEGGADAVAAGSIFHFTDQSPIMTRNYLFNQQVNIRP